MGWDGSKETSKESTAPIQARDGPSEESTAPVQAGDEGIVAQTRLMVTGLVSSR